MRVRGLTKPPTDELCPPEKMLSTDTPLCYINQPKRRRIMPPDEPRERRAASDVFVARCVPTDQPFFAGHL